MKQLNGTTIPDFVSKALWEKLPSPQNSFQKYGDLALLEASRIFVLGK